MCDIIVVKDILCKWQKSYFLSFVRYQISEDQWKRRKMSEPDSIKAGEERQIIRVTQQQQTQHQSASSSVGKQQFQHSVEPVSPPEATSNHYGRRFYESTTATSTSGTPSNKPHLSPLDYVKNKIVEVMRTSEDDKAGGSGSTVSSDRNGGSGNVVPSGGGNGGGDKTAEEKAATGANVERSPSVGGVGGSGEMVVDEPTPNRTTPQPPPPPAPAPTTNFYPFSALGVHTGPPPAPPPTATSTVSASVTKSEQMQPEPAPLLSAQYEPLSDED